MTLYKRYLYRICISCLLLRHICVPLTHLKQVPQSEETEEADIDQACKGDDPEVDEYNPYKDYPREKLPLEIQQILSEPKEYEGYLFTRSSVDLPYLIGKDELSDEWKGYRKSGLRKCPWWMRIRSPYKLIYDKWFHARLEQCDIPWALELFRKIPGLTVRELLAIGHIEVHGVPMEKIDVPLDRSFGRERLARVNAIAVDIIEMYVRLIFDEELQEQYNTIELLPEEVEDKFQSIADLLNKARAGELQYLDPVYFLVDNDYLDTKLICKGLWNPRARLAAYGDARLFVKILLILLGFATDNFALTREGVASYEAMGGR